MGNAHRPGSSRSLHFLAVPLLTELQRPVRIFVLMTAIARIRNFEFFGQCRIRDRKSMVMPDVPLHINRLRHVTVNAFSSSFLDCRWPIVDQIHVLSPRTCSQRKNLVMTMTHRVDGRGVRVRSRMTSQTKQIPRQKRFARMGIVTITADYPTLMHPAADK